MNRWSHAIWAVALGLCTAFGQDKLTEEMIIHQSTVRNAAISPDGSRTAFLRSVVEGTPSRRTWELWTVDHASEETKRFVRAPVSADHPVWSADGKYIYFSAVYRDYSDRSQVYRVPVSGGSVERVFSEKKSIDKFQVSADAQMVVYIAQASESYDGQAPVINELNTNYRYLYVHDLKLGRTRQISLDSLHVVDFDLSPVGDRVVYRATESVSVDEEYMFSRMYVADLLGKNGRILCDHQGKLEGLRWAPDGRHIAFRGGVDLSDPTDGSLFVADASPGSARRNLTDQFAGSVEGFEWTNASELIFTAQVNAHCEVWQAGLSGGLRRIQGESSLTYGEFSWSRDGHVMSLSASSSTHPGEVCLFDPDSVRWRRLTISNPGWNRVVFAESMEIRYRAVDGLDIYGVVVKPVGFEAGRKYPLVVYVHGGPESAETVGWNTTYAKWTQILAQEGFLVFFPNYRGSTGRGVQFAKLNHKDPMGKDFQDILDGIDHLTKLGWVDPTRVGITGGSYGGYATAWGATKHSHRFAAAVMMVGTTNQISKAGTTDTPSENALVHMTQWMYDDDYRMMWDRSPLKYVKQCRTPLLIAHGDSDKRVPTGQSIELFRAVRHFKKAPVELIIYPGEGHGNRKPDNQLDYMKRGLDWMRRHLRS